MTSTQRPSPFSLLVPALLAVLSLFACDFGSPVPNNNNNNNNDPPPATVGYIQFTLADGFSSPITADFKPSVSLDPANAHYVIAGTGPSGGSFTYTSYASTYNSAELLPGLWSVNVKVRDIGDSVIAEGQGSVTVVAGTTAPLAMDLTRGAGTGNLTLAASWTQDMLASATMDGSLLPAQGSAIGLTFSVNSAASTARCAKSGIPAGLYALTVNLKNGASLLATQTATVFIMAGLGTAGSLSYTIGDGLTVTIFYNQAKALSLALGATVDGEELSLDSEPSLTEGSEMIITANSADSIAGYQWYLEGDPIEDASSPTRGLGSALACGHYTVDVVCWDATGKSYGSAGFSFRIVE